MHRFFTPSLTKNSKNIVMEDLREIHHLKDVLRLKSGQTIQLFNGAGCKAEGRIIEISSNKISIQLEKTTEESAELPILILACAVPKKGKFETIIEKTTELGIDEIIPLKTKNSDVTFKLEKMNSKLERFQKVALNAAKQSNRSTIPVIHPMTEFSSVVENLLTRSTVIIPSLTKNSKKFIPVLEKLSSPTVISFLIGPEGDFSEQEYKLAHDSGCLPVSLGKTILKVETAAIASIATTRLFFNK
ncbi:MAG: 16S rRNA (uracil(1498)-N(3))-methyltransferase [Candidatus Omnitrophica bacterium]|nr:16S rRNA (uracil(1498)-N(3))-methyltransferase [Candidatus Omnitrophota bacterium]